MPAVQEGGARRGRRVRGARRLRQLFGWRVAADRSAEVMMMAVVTMSNYFPVAEAMASQAGQAVRGG